MSSKVISVKVGKDFVVPDLYEDDTKSNTLRENALIIGAKAVVFAENDDKFKLLEQQLDELKSKQKKREDELKEDYRIRLEKEKEILIEQNAHRHKVDEDSIIRQALISVREKSLQEKDDLIRNLNEERRKDIAHRDKEIEELRGILKELRSEHQDLTVKLISRIEGTKTQLSSSAIGRSFEENVQKYFRQVFGAREGFVLEDVHGTGHSGDLIMTYDGLRIMIELKSYDPKTKIPTKEIEKFARDLSEVSPGCDAGILLSACSEITGYHSYGPLEVSSTAACVPVLFVNNFMSLGEPQLTLHMARAFLAMIRHNKEGDKEVPEETGDLQRITQECVRRCNTYLTELNHQSSELIKQVINLKNCAGKLKEAVQVLIENEVGRFTGIIKLISQKSEEVTCEAPAEFDESVFADWTLMSEKNRMVASKIMELFTVDETAKYPTKDFIVLLQEQVRPPMSEKQCRDLIKAVFREEVIAKGYILKIARKA